MTNGEPAYTVIVVQNQNQTCINGYAYMKMSAKDYINSIPMTFEQYSDRGVEPDEIPDHLRKKPKKGKKHKQRREKAAAKREKAIQTMCQERGHFSISPKHDSNHMTDVI